MRTRSGSPDSPVGASRHAGDGGDCVLAPTDAPPPALVLIVDDEPGIVAFLCLALEDNGYRVATARDGLVALDQIDLATPEIVLTDLMMPRLSGWELCKTLRARSDTRTIPIVAMSAVDARGAAVDAFLPKPFELAELLETMARLTPLTVACRPDAPRPGAEARPG